MKRILVTSLLLSLFATQAQASEPFGTFLRPFAANSLWNSRPVNPTFGNYAITSNVYDPAIQGGAFSTTAFLAAATDAPMTIYPLAGHTGVYDPDAEEDKTSITIPHWPANVLPATGSDGHADIYDPTTNIIYSLYQLKQVNGQWQAGQYAWTTIDGTGWSEPGHRIQGLRATGVPSSAGLIRINEAIQTDQPYFTHALAMSLPRENLSANPTMVYPAVAADKDAATTNLGQIPEGALLMLPPDYTIQIANPDPKLVKVIETLKRYGGRVVDRNTQTPFGVYVEIGANFNLYTGDLAALKAELNHIRSSLRVATATSFIDGNEQVFSGAVPADTNILSMRGPWAAQVGSVFGKFNTFSQSIEFPAMATVVPQSNGNGTGVARFGQWATPKAGDTFKITAIASGGAAFRMQLYSGGTLVHDTGYLTDGQSRIITWPTGGWTTLYVQNAANEAGTVRATMVKQ